MLQGLAREARLNLTRARNGARYATGAEFAPIGPTPSQVVWRSGKAQLRHYPNPDKTAYAVPVVAFGGLVGRSYIFDLTASNSFVRRIHAAGFDAFVLDWGQPDHEDAGVSLETYLCDYLPAAIRAACRTSGADVVNLIGYCMGGTLALHGLPAQPELPVRALVSIAAPIDFACLNVMVDTVRDGRLDPASVLDDSGNLPAGLLTSFFRVIKPTAGIVQYVNLWQHLGDEQYLEGFQALSRCFNDQVPVAGAAWLQIAEQWIQGDAFLRGTLQLADRPVRLEELTLPVLVVVGSRDELVPEASTAPLCDLLPGADVEYMRLEAGHASLTTGRTAAKVTVPQILGWLAQHSEPIGAHARM
ncbi:Poly(3-hydroxyalkanoate) polymerase subunit PhaC [Paraconexibacter sp. AEG42_29]|uniref:Poly(3-hydroxyalkanoate) polymerase subunit PhaC n=2 Tax=Paraconexibacter sp. AEG42_29 TaxID=2997339 RepID=A0AAU7B3D6_9ACTN